MKSSGSMVDKKSEIMQFFGKLDNQSYREFRVKLSNLAEVTGDKSVYGLFQVGLKQRNDYHSTRISELENELRYHQQMRKCWNSFEKTTNEFNMELVARLLLSKIDFIKEFEDENFANDESWTMPIKTKNGAEMKAAISRIGTLNENGKDVEKKEQRKVDENGRQRSMSTSKVCEDTSLKLEKLELTVRQQPNEQNSQDTQETAEVVDQVLGKNNCDRNMEVSKKESVSSFADSECDIESEKKEDEHEEKWSETTSLEPRLGNTDTCSSSLGSCEFEAADEELNSPREERGSSISNQNVAKLGQGASSKKSSGNNRGKGKKGRKGNKGPKMTIEEIEAIKKQKKDAADKAFEEREKEMNVHLKKVEKTDKHRVHRRLAETALEMLRNGNGVLPPEMKDLNNLFDEFVRESDIEQRFGQRDEFVKTRTEEINETILGQEQIQKLNLLTNFQEVFGRTQLLQSAAAFSVTLHEANPSFKIFERRIIHMYLNGCEEENESVNAGIVDVETERDFEMFKDECLSHLPESEKWTMARENILHRLSVLKDHAVVRNLNQDEKSLRDAYTGIANLLETYNQCTNVMAFLHQNRNHSSFDLMEAWMMESRRPPPLVLTSFIDS